AFDAASELAGDSLSDCAFETVSALVHADSAAAFLDFGHRGRAGDDDFRIVAQQPRVRPGAGIAAAGQHGACAGGDSERLPVGAFPGYEPPARFRTARAEPDRNLAVRAGNSSPRRADRAALPIEDPDAAGSLVCVRRNGGLRFYRQPAERGNDRARGGL